MMTTTQLFKLFEMPKEKRKKLTKNQRRRLKRRQKKLEERNSKEKKTDGKEVKEVKKVNEDVVIEYVVDDSLKKSLGIFFNQDSVDKIFGKFTQLTSNQSDSNECCGTETGSGSS